MRTMLIAVTMIGGALLLLGCGSTRHDVATGEYGSLRGLVITPEPQSLGIATSTVFYLDWVSGYNPPEEFTISLRKVHADGTTTPVLTQLKSSGPRHYRLEPSWYLEPETFLLLRVSAPREQAVRAIYLTEHYVSYATRPLRHEGGEEEHTVTVELKNAP